MNRLEPYQWMIILWLFTLGVACFTVVAEALWRLARRRPLPPPYDWEQDAGWLDVLARDEQGEVLAIIPASWRYK